VPSHLFGHGEMKTL